MEFIVETRIPDLTSIPLADMGRYEEARLAGGVACETVIPATRFQSSI